MKLAACPGSFLGYYKQEVEGGDYIYLLIIIIIIIITRYSTSPKILRPVLGPTEADIDELEWVLGRPRDSAGALALWGGLWEQGSFSLEKGRLRGKPDSRVPLSPPGASEEGIDGARLVTTSPELFCDEDRTQYIKIYKETEMMLAEPKCEVDTEFKKRRLMNNCFLPFPHVPQPPLAWAPETLHRGELWGDNEQKQNCFT